MFQFPKTMFHLYKLNVLGLEKQYSKFSEIKYYILMDGIIIPVKMEKKSYKCYEIIRKSKMHE
jgi:hypothetical protein